MQYVPRWGGAEAPPTRPTRRESSVAFTLSSHRGPSIGMIWAVVCHEHDAWRAADQLWDHEWPSSLINPEDKQLSELERHQVRQEIADFDRLVADAFRELRHLRRCERPRHQGVVGLLQLLGL